jgi:hypothetical protein
MADKWRAEMPLFRSLNPDENRENLAYIYSQSGLCRTLAGPIQLE